MTDTAKDKFNYFMDKEFIRGHSEGWTMGHRSATRSWHDLIEKAVELKMIDSNSADCLLRIENMMREQGDM